MSSSDDHFDEPFEDHTLLKHAILKAYLAAWAFKLLNWGGGGTRIVFVDGFAGAGRDSDGNHGSPVLACRVAQEVRGHFLKRPEAVDRRLAIVAVEKSAKNYKSLVKMLAPFKAIEPMNVTTLHGKFADHVDAITHDCGAMPTLYFLDPFGVSGLDASWYAKLMSGASNEIFVLFSDVGAARLRGVFHASDDDLAERLAMLTVEQDLFPDGDAIREAAIRAEAARRAAARAPTGKAAAVHITAALGDDSWKDDLDGMSNDAARFELVARFITALHAAGAEYIQVIPMRDAAGAHKHCLVHASKSMKGWIAMKEAVSSGLNKADLSAKMLDRIKDDLRVTDAVRDLLRDFAGLELGWTDRIKPHLLGETDVFPFQFSEIKKELKNLGVLSKKKYIDVCTFPDVSDG